MKVVRLVPLDALVPFQRHWPVRVLWGLLLVTVSHLVVLLVVWARFGLDIALFATGALAATLLLTGEAVRDRGDLLAKRIWLIAANEFRLPTTESIKREVSRGGHSGGRRQGITQNKDIPPKRKVNGRPICKVHYKPGRSRWSTPKPSDILCIDLNYAGSAWKESDPRAVRELRARLESRLSPITLRVEQTDEMRQQDWIRLWQAAPLPNRITLEHVKAAYHAAGDDFRGKMIVGFVAPDTTGPHVIPVTFTDPEQAKKALLEGEPLPEAQTFYVLAVDPRKVPHFRVHGATGRGKTVTLDDLLFAFLLYGSVHGEGMGRVVGADCKLAGTFVKWKHSGQVRIPRTEQEIVDMVAAAKGLMDRRAETLDRSADVIVDAWNDGTENPPPVPTFEPTLTIIDEYASLTRWLENQDKIAKANREPATVGPQFMSNLADLIQKGRALDMHVGVSSQAANVEGAGGARFPSDVRAQAELVIHMGPTSEEAGRVVYGTKDGADWAREIPDIPGYAGIAIGTNFYIAKMAYVFDPVAHGDRNMRVDPATRLDTYLNGDQPTPSDPEPDPEPEAPPTVELFRLEAGSGPVVEGEEEDE